MYQIKALNKISSKGMERLTPSFAMVEEMEQAQGILVRSQDMHSLPVPPGLLAVARAGAGVNNIPVESYSRQGIVVFNTPGANANSVKELVLTAILMSSRNVYNAITWTKTLTTDVAELVESGKGQFAGHEIKGKTLGVVGLGAIGVMVANAAEALGMKILGYDPYISIKSAHELSSSVEICEHLDQLLPRCDYVTIHVPFKENTKELINGARLDLMKKDSCILNFSRDQIVHDQDMLAALAAGKIRRYITDFPSEGLIGHEGVVCIPHLGASTKESEDNCAVMAVEQLMDYLENGNISNSVNFPSCDLGTPSTLGRIAVMNLNVPSMLGKITGILADRNVNISDLLNRSKGDYAYTLIDVDSHVDEKEIKEALKMEGIISVRVIR